MLMIFDMYLKYLVTLVVVSCIAFVLIPAHLLLSEILMFIICGHIWSSEHEVVISG